MRRVLKTKGWNIYILRVPVKRVCHILGLWMEETASRYGGNLRIHWICSCKQPTKGGPPVLGLGEGLTIPHLKKESLLRNVTQGLGNGGLLW